MMNNLVPQAKPVSREQVMRLEDAMFGMPDDLKIDLEPLTKHHFADGVYLRQLTIPAGVIVTGKIHKTRHLTIICSGTVKITTDDGVVELTGPAVFVSEPGIKKAAYAITDTVVMNPHPTHLTDVDEIERKFIAPSFEALAMEKDDVGTDRSIGRVNPGSSIQSEADSEAPRKGNAGQSEGAEGISASSRCQGKAKPR
jgi:hypothetical protein